MKDSVLEFEKLNDKVEKFFEAFSLNPLDWFKDKREAEPNASYQKGQAVDKYLSSIESGEECAPGVSNNRFHSEPGSNSATFYSIKNKKLTPTGFVKDIKPFLANAGLSKRVLRCYDLKKDKLNIAWLFNGEFNADILDWNKKQRKVIFQGTWKNGLFAGLNYPKVTEPTVESPLKKQYFILKKNQEIGPYSAAQILKLVEKKQLNTNSIVRPTESTDYQYVGKDKILAMLLKAIATPAKKSTKKSNPASQL